MNNETVPLEANDHDQRTVAADKLETTVSREKQEADTTVPLHHLVRCQSVRNLIDDLTKFLTEAFPAFGEDCVREKLGTPFVERLVAKQNSHCGYFVDDTGELRPKNGTDIITINPEFHESFKVLAYWMGFKYPLFESHTNSADAKMISDFYAAVADVNRQISQARNLANGETNAT